MYTTLILSVQINPYHFSLSKNPYRNIFNLLWWCFHRSLWFLTQKIHWVDKIKKYILPISITFKRNLINYFTVNKTYRLFSFPFVFIQWKLLLSTYKSFYFHLSCIKESWNAISLVASKQTALFLEFLEKYSFIFTVSGHSLSNSMLHLWKLFYCKNVLSI